MSKLNYFPKKILIVGNGFDLDQKLPTSYSNFIESPYFKNILNNTRNIGRIPSLAYHLNQVKDLIRWIDIENELKIYSNTYSDSLKNNLFKEQFYTLKRALIGYLRSIDYNNIDRNAVSYNIIKNLIKEDFLIIDFNYSSTIRNILFDLGYQEKDKIEKNLIKIHGSIEEDEIIFGVEDFAEIPNPHVFLKKAYSEIFKGITFDEQLSRATEIHIFGHSLGETDHTYFKNFFDLFSLQHNAKNGKKIFLYHYGETGKHQLYIQLDTLTNRRLSGLKQVNDFKDIDVSKQISNNNSNQ